MSKYEIGTLKTAVWSHAEVAVHVHVAVVFWEAAAEEKKA